MIGGLGGGGGGVQTFPGTKVSVLYQILAECSKLSSENE